MGYVVTAPLALIDRQDGSLVTVYRGGAVPEDVDPAHLEHLKDFGLVEESVEPLSGLEPTRNGDGTVIEDESESTPKDADEDESKPPAQSAPKAEWVAYAESQGVAHDEAEGLTKEQLVERFKG